MAYQEKTVLDYIEGIKKDKGEAYLANMLKSFSPEQQSNLLGKIQEAKKIRLTEAQKVVKYQFSEKDIKERTEAAHPKNWKPDYSFAMDEQWKEKYGQELGNIFTKDFWKKAYRNNLPKAHAMMYEMNVGMKMRWMKRTLKAVGKVGSYAVPQGQAIRAMIDAGEGDPFKAGAEEAARTAWDMLVYAPRTAANFYKNPMDTIQNEGLELIGLMGMLVGAKVAKGVFGKYTKAKAQGKPMSLSEFTKPLEGTPHLSQQFRRQMKAWGEGDIMLETARAEPLEIVSPMKKGSAPVFQHEVQALIKDVARHGDIADRPLLYGAKTSKGFLNIGFRTPLRVFEKFKGMREMLYDKARYGGKLALDEKGQMIKDLKGWKKAGVTKKMQKEVGIHMTALQKDGMQLLADMGVEVPKMSNPKLGMKYMEWLRGKYDGYLKRINLVRTQAGLKAIDPIENYATWVRNLHKLSEAGIDIAKADARTVKHVLAQAFKYSKGRKPGTFLEGVELDAGLVYQTYSNAAIEHIHMTPVIAKARAFLKPITTKYNYQKRVKLPKKKGQAQKYKMVTKTKQKTFNMKHDAPNWSAWLSEWSDTIAGVHKAIPKSKVGKYFRAIRGLQRNVAVGVLGWNVRSALIQPTALRLSYVMLGENNTMYGFWKNFSSKKWRKFAMDESQVLKGRIKNYSMDVHVAMAREATVGKKFAGGKQRFAEASMKPLQLLDFETARASWIGAYRLAEKMLGKGMKGKRLGTQLHKAAVKWADDVVTRTQASAAIWDIAPVQRTVWGKFLTMFQTFVINEFDFLTSDLFHYKNPYVPGSGAAGNVSRLALATGVINYVTEGILKIRSPYPAPVTAYLRATQQDKTSSQIVLELMKEFGETIPIAGSSIRWSTAWKTTAPAGVQVGFLDPGQMVIRFMNKPSLTVDQAEWLAKVVGLPGASQASKFHRRIRRGQNWWEALIGVREEIKPKKRKRRANPWKF